MAALIQDNPSKGKGQAGNNQSVLALAEADEFAGLFSAQGSVLVGAQLRKAT